MASGLSLELRGDHRMCRFYGPGGGGNVRACRERLAEMYIRLERRKARGLPFRARDAARFKELGRKLGVS